MSYRVIVDSCGELTPQMKESGIFKTASLSMEVDGFHIPDDETFDQADFLRRVAASEECPKSSCPSPERYMELYKCDVDRVYAVTLSGELSGSITVHFLERNFIRKKAEKKRSMYLTLVQHLSERR